MKRKVVVIALTTVAVTAATYLYSATSHGVDTGQIGRGWPLAYDITDYGLLGQSTSFSIVAFLEDWAISFGVLLGADYLRRAVANKKRG
jgi:hypothetical protein